MKIGNHGIVSYAGLSKDALLSGTGVPFPLKDIPKLYRDFIPLFPAEMIQNMDYIGKAAEENRYVATSGFSISPAEYHRKMYADFPALYTGENRSRNFDYEDRFQGTGVFTVDDAWGGSVSPIQAVFRRKAGPSPDRAGVPGGSGARERKNPHGLSGSAGGATRDHAARAIVRALRRGLCALR